MLKYVSTLKYKHVFKGVQDLVQRSLDSEVKDNRQIEAGVRPVSVKKCRWRGELATGRSESREEAPFLESALFSALSADGMFIITFKSLAINKIKC